MKYHQGRLIDDIRLRVVDLERSRRFYKAVLEALGLIDSYGDASGCFYADSATAQSGTREER